MVIQGPMAPLAWGLLLIAAPIVAYLWQGGTACALACAGSGAVVLPLLWVRRTP